MNSMSVLLVIQTLADYNKTRKVGKKTPKSKKHKKLAAFQAAVKWGCNNLLY